MEAMHTRCLYCDHALGSPGARDGVRPGVRVAFDPERGRLWSVCDRCYGWNLWWQDARSDAIEALERTGRKRARVLYQTEHISLMEVGRRQLVRVGPAPRREETWWRYGRHLRRLRDRFRSPVTRLATATYSAVSSVGTSVGLSSVTGDFRRAIDRRVEILRWRRFGGTAWSGRAPCPNCGSVLIRLPFMTCTDLILMPGPGGAAAVGMPCSRCDHWTGEETHRFNVPTSEPLLRRVLAWHNIEGATNRELSGAADLIERAGSARALIRRFADERLPLYAMDRTDRLALEIAVNDRAERARLACVAASLEAGWRRAEELAAIIEEEL